MRTVEWHNGKVRMIDQRELPWELVHVEYDNYTDVARAITDMVVRGAPAIVAAADAPARPEPTMMTSNFLLLAGFTSFMSKRCLSHMSWMGPDGIFESSCIVAIS